MSQRQRGDMRVLAHIREHYNLSLGSYGRPRMTMELKEAGLDVGEHSKGRLMRINGIRPVRTRKHKLTTDSNHSLGIAPNILDGNFLADGPNQKWAGDISYIWTSEGWLYLAVILDLHSRRVVRAMTLRSLCSSCGPALSRHILPSRGMLRKPANGARPRLTGARHAIPATPSARSSVNGLKKYSDGRKPAPGWQRQGSKEETAWPPALCWA